MDTSRIQPSGAGRAVLSILTTVCLAGAASAQHAQTVLAGEPNADGLALPMERQAVHPLTGPYFHEDSFVTTDVRAWFVRHNFPADVNGGHATVIAVQARAALTESVQIVAYKDGFVDFNDGLVNDNGMNDIAAGIKWAFLQDWATDTHAAVGVGYEIGVGDEEVLQGDDEVRIWGSYNKGFDRLHLGATLNAFFPVGSEDALGDSERISWHLHADYHVNQFWSPVVEVNGYQTLSNGDNAPLPVSGVDVANLGGGEDEDVITAGYGFEVRPLEGIALRVAHESPLTDNVDLYGNRWTLSAVWSF